MKEKQEPACSLCEFSHKICGGEYYICQKKGIVSPDGSCRKFTFDPMKMEVSVSRIPSVPDVFIH